MEQSAIEQEIKSKAKEWVEEYGADFLVELIDVYLEDTPNRLAQMRQAFAGGDNETLCREAHTVKSSSANVGAMSLAALAREIEAAAQMGKVDGADEKARRIDENFQLVKLTLAAVRKAAVENNAEF